MGMGYVEGQSLFHTFKIKPRELGTNIPFSPSAVGCPNNWAFLVAQTVKNLPAMRQTWVQSLGWEDPLEEGMATPSHILAWRIPMDRGAWRGRVGVLLTAACQLGSLWQVTSLFPFLLLYTRVLRPPL